MLWLSSIADNKIPVCTLLPSCYEYKTRVMAQGHQHFVGCENTHNLTAKTGTFWGFKHNVATDHFVFVGGGALRQLAANGWIVSCFYNNIIYCSPGCGTCSFRYQPNSLGSIQLLLPSRHWKLFKHTSNHCPTRYPFTPGLTECTYRCSAMPKDTAPTLRQLRTTSKTSRSSVAGRSHRTMTPYMYIEYIFRYRDTEGGHCHVCLPVHLHNMYEGLISIYSTSNFLPHTARELVIFGGSFISHSVSVRWHRHLPGHASQERYTVSTVKGQEINLHKLPLQWASNPRPPVWQALTLPLHYHSLQLKQRQIIKLTRESSMLCTISSYCFQVNSPSPEKALCKHTSFWAF